MYEIVTTTYRKNSDIRGHNDYWSTDYWCDQIGQAQFIKKVAHSLCHMSFMDLNTWYLGQSRVPVCRTTFSRSLSISCMTCRNWLRPSRVSGIHITNDLICLSCYRYVVVGANIWVWFRKMDLVWLNLAEASYYRVDLDWRQVQLRGRYDVRSGTFHTVNTQARACVLLPPKIGYHETPVMIPGLLIALSLFIVVWTY